MIPGGKRQRQRILDLLVSAHGGEVPSPARSRIRQYGARVKELREMGFPIVNRTERRDGKVFGYFRLEMGETRSIARHDKSQTTEQLLACLFPDEAERHLG